jgi:hypothetical protein
MRRSLMIVGALLAACGTVWLLQGIDFLPGSFMTGQTKWAIIGGVVLSVGVALLVIAGRLGRPGDSR